MSSFTLPYFIRDHLGSVRAVVDGSTGDVLETSDYLPFGKRWELTGGQTAQTVTDPTNRWRFSGKETQSFYNPAIPYNDFGARLHDPRTGRWLAVDPMAEKYYGYSPWTYCGDNPTNAVDSDGQIWNFVAGAAVGALIEGGITLVEGGSGREVLAAAAKGAVEGVAMAGGGLIAGKVASKVTSKVAAYAAEAIVNAVGSGAGSVTEQVINQEEISGAKTAISAGVGVITSGLHNGFGAYGKKLIEKKVSSQSFKEEQKEIARQYLKTKEKHPSKSTVNRVTNNAIKNIEQNEKETIETVKTIYEYSGGLYVNGKITNYVYDRVQK